MPTDRSRARDDWARAVGRLRAFAGVYGWLLRDLIAWAPRRVLWVAAVNLGAVAVAGAAIGGIFAMARALEAGEALSFAEISVELAGWSLALAVTGLAASGVIAGALAYRSEWLNAEIATAYQGRITGLLLGTVGGDDLRWVRGLPRADRSAVGGIFAVGVRMASVAVRNLLGAILPAMVMVSALAGLLWIDPRVAVWLLPFGVGYLGIVYASNVQVSQGAGALRIELPQFRRRMADAQARATDFDRAERAAGMAEWEEIEREHLPSVMRLFYARILADDWLQVFNNGFMYIGILVVFLVFALGGGRESAGWSGLLGVILALRFLVGSLRSVSALGIKLSRFYPEITPVVGAIRALEGPQRASGEGSWFRREAKIRDDAAGAELDLGSGDILVVADRLRNRVELALTLGALERAQTRGVPFLEAADPGALDACGGEGEFRIATQRADGQTRCLTLTEASRWDGVVPPGVVVVHVGPGAEVHVGGDRPGWHGSADGPIDASAEDEDEAGVF